MAVSRDVVNSTRDLAIKARFEKLIDALSGLAKAKTRSGTRVSLTQLSSYQGTNTDAFPPADVIADLEKVSPIGPVLTEFLAGEAGYAMFKLPDGTVTLGDYMIRLGALMKGTGALSVSITTATAATSPGGRKICSSEREPIKADLRSLIADAVGMLMTLEAEGEE